MRLKDYDYSNVGAYFVTVCIQNRESNLLENQEVKQMIERWILKIEENYSHFEKVYANIVSTWSDDTNPLHDELLVKVIILNV